MIGLSSQKSLHNFLIARVFGLTLRERLIFRRDNLYDYAFSQLHRLERFRRKHHTQPVPNPLYPQNHAQYRTLLLCASRINRPKRLHLNQAHGNNVHSG